jgi:hypothetical protein
MEEPGRRTPIWPNSHVIAPEEGRRMDRKNMELAANLLAKAIRTDFDPEAIAL